MLILVNRIPKTFDDFRDTTGLGFLLSPSQTSPSWVDHLRTHPMPWACDNDCFNGFDEDRYRRMLGMVDGVPGCLFVTAPDVVGDSRTTIGLFDLWLPELYGDGDRFPIAIVGQDGMENCDVDHWFGMADAFFIGGSTEWKLSSAAADLAAEAKKRSMWVHMGRVNSQKRAQVAFDIGCDSIDGSTFHRHPNVKLPPVLGRIKHLRKAPRLF